MSAATQAKKLALRTSAFDEMRRQTNKGLRQELDRYTDMRDERYRRKFAALDVDKLSKPGFHDPRKELAKMRERVDKASRSGFSF